MKTKIHRRIGALFLSLVLCLTLLPATALADDDTTNSVTVAGTELNGTTQYATTDDSGRITTDDAGTENYNVHWDAEDKTLTLKDAKLTVSNTTAAIAADVDVLTIILEGTNTITGSISAPKNDQNDGIYAAVINKGGSIAITDKGGTGKLTVSLTMTNESNHVNCKAMGIKANTAFSNDADIEVSISGSGSVAYDLTGIYADYVPVSGGTGAAFTNSGTINVSSTSTGSENATAVLFGGTAFTNSGTITATAEASSGKANGLNLSGTFQDNRKSLTNSGSITIKATTEASKEDAYGLWIENSSSPGIEMENAESAVLKIDEVSSSDTAYGIGINSNGEVTLKNDGTVEIKTDGANSSIGITLTSYWENVALTNTGEMAIESETETDGSAYGIAMFLNYITGTDVHKTALNLNSGSTLTVTTSGGNNCMAVLQQRCYHSSKAEGDTGENQIFFNGTVLQETGTVYTEYQNSNDQHCYISSIVDGEGTPLAVLHVTPAILVTNVGLGETSLSLAPGDTAQLTATVTPADATDKTVTWSSSDTSIATVDSNGKVTAVAPGTVTITVTANDGSDVKAECTVTVNTPSSGGGGTSTRYRVTVEDSAHGTVESNRTSASRDSTVTLTVIPDKGYELDSLTVTDSRGDEIDLSDKGSGKFTFTMPGRAVTVEAVFSKIEETPAPWNNPFTDVSETDWFYSAVEYVHTHGLMNGTSATTFSPESTTTRGQIVTILWRMEDSPAVDYLMDFADVDPDAYYGEAVRWATSEGIVGGYGNDKFGPDDPITREQFAAILYRYAQHKGYDVSTAADLSGYTDADKISDYALEAMGWANDAGILGGTSPTTLYPQDTATRAQAAAMFMRFCEQYAGK